MKKYEVETVYETDYTEIIEEYPLLEKVLKEEERGFAYIEAESLEQALDILEPIVRKRTGDDCFCIKRENDTDWVIEIYDNYRE